MTQTVSALHVTKKVYEAVCKLREDNDKARAVWIIGVSVNQEDVDEYNRRVRRMRHICESAA